MQAIGTPLRLKRRYGGGFRLSMFLDSKKTSDANEAESRILSFLSKRLGDGVASVVQRVEENFLFRIESSSSSRGGVDGARKIDDDDNDDESSHDKMTALFRDLENSREDLGVKDFSIGLPTLEEVFLELSIRDHGSDVASAATVKIREKDAKELVESRRTLRRVTCAGQSTALCCKNVRYQLSHKGQLCCIIFFPLVIMLLLLLLDTLLFEKYRIIAMCGEDVSKSECKEKGIDLDCVAQQYKKTYETNPTMDVGLISDFYRGRTGINPNCNSDTCFENLEQPRWDAMKLSVAPDVEAFVGSVSYSPSVNLSNWYLDFLNRLDGDYCNQAYDNNFDCKNYDVKQECYDLKSARDWYNVNVATSRDAGTSGDEFGEFTGTDACMPDSQTGTVSTPSTATLTRLEEIEDERTQCFQNFYTGLLYHFESIDLETEIMSAVATRNATGASDSILGTFYTSRLVEDDAMRGLAYEVAAVALDNAKSNTSSFTVTNFTTLAAQVGANLESLFMAPSMSLLCFGGCQSVNVQGNYDRTSVCPLWSLITDVTGSVDRTENVCLYLQRIDAVRAVRFRRSDDRQAMNRDLFDAWYGVERTTPVMSAEMDYSYLYHFYLSDWTARAFSVVDDARGKYEYVTYYNNSATENRPGLRNWIYSIWQVDDSVVRKHTGRGLRVFKRSFPREFTCNRDEWLDDPWTNLDCDLLWGPLRFSILDFVMIQFMPMILLLLQFVIVSAIVYEKANRLRMITKMMGLKSSVYWAVNYVFYYAQYWAMIVVMWTVGVFANVQAFRLHDPAVLFCIFFFWGHLLIISSFLLTVFFSSPRTATVAALLILILAPTIGDAIFYQVRLRNNT